MEKVKATKNGVNFEFKLRGFCKYGGIEKDKLYAKLVDKKIVKEEDSIISKMLMNKSFQTHPIENELLLVSATFSLMGLKATDTTYNMIHYPKVTDHALGAIAEHEGKKYIVSVCPNEIGPHFIFQYENLNPSSSLCGHDLIIMEQNIILGDASHGFSIYAPEVKQKQLGWYINNDYQFWQAYYDFVFCLREK